VLKRTNLSHAGFIMAETMISLSILTSVLLFWGNMEVMMQQHERRLVRTVHSERIQYEKYQLSVPAVSRRLKHAK